MSHAYSVGGSRGGPPVGVYVGLNVASGGVGFNVGEPVGIVGDRVGSSVVLVGALDG